MPFTHPTRTQLVDRAIADISSRLAGTNPLLRRALVNILARMHADATFSLYGYQDWITEQILPDTAEAEILDRHALWRTGLARIAAVAATGPLLFTGSDGAVIPAGTSVQIGDQLYTTDADATIAGGSATATITAEVAGAAGNQVAGVTVALLSPISGVQSQPTVSAPGLTGGADTESDDHLRARMLDALRTSPQGGSLADYVAWAKAAHPDVTDAWAYENEMGPGTVTVRVMTYGATADGIPVAAVLDAVTAYIDGRRQAGMSGLYVVAPIAQPLDFTITGLAPNTQAVKDAIAAELADLIQREAEPAGTIPHSHFDEAISLAEGETDHTLTVPAGAVTCATGYITTMGNITWA